uniref:Uncharacterized protein n=1 Tax=Bursaphelenchus xylophilus TaxID=6326 RepID=A0A1I7SLT2_BURXY
MAVLLRIRNKPSVMVISKTGRMTGGGHISPIHRPSVPDLNSFSSWSFIWPYIIAFPCLLQKRQQNKGIKTKSWLYSFLLFFPTLEPSISAPKHNFWPREKSLRGQEKTRGRDGRHFLDESREFSPPLIPHSCRGFDPRGRREASALTLFVCYCDHSTGTVRINGRFGRTGRSIQP